MGKQNNRLFKNIEEYEKRKLNSKNPKYWDKSLVKEQKIKKKKLECIAHNGVKVYSIWYDTN
jgi:ABC-type oligopeptide transport system substrate-binding subunit